MHARTIAAAAATLAALALPAAAAAAVPGTAPVHGKGATNLGAYSARSMSVTLALAPRSGLDALLAQQAAGKAGPISSRQFNARYAPTAKSVAAVRSFAAANSLRVSSVSANRMLVRLTGSSAAFSRAFHTRFDSFRLPGGTTYFASTRTARLPKPVASHTASVLGLSSLGRASLPHHSKVAGATPHLPANLPSVPKLPNVTGPQTHAGSGIAYPSDYGPQDLANLYNAGSTPTGSGQTVAVIAEGDLTRAEAGPGHVRGQVRAPARGRGPPCRWAPRRATPRATTSGTSTRSTRPASRPASPRCACMTARRCRTTTSRPRSTAG